MAPRWPQGGPKRAWRVTRGLDALKTVLPIKNTTQKKTDNQKSRNATCPLFGNETPSATLRVREVEAHCVSIGIMKPQPPLL